MSHTIPTQQPAVILRSDYRRLRALLAVAIIAVLGLTIAVVVLAANSAGSTTAVPAARANPSAILATPSAVTGAKLDHRGLSTKQTIPAVSPGAHALPPGQLGTYVRRGSLTGNTSALKLTADGRYTQALAGGPVINGTWSFRDGKITFTETGGSGAACIGRAGSYSWSYAARKLALSAISEPCQVRSQDFSSGSFGQRS